MRSMATVCIGLTLAVPAMAEPPPSEWDWSLGAFMEHGLPNDAPKLGIYPPCDGPFDQPDTVARSECIVASIGCTSREIRLTVALSQETLGAWITSQKGFHAELSIGNSRALVLTPREMYFGDLNGEWFVKSVSDDGAALPDQAGDIRIDLGVKSFVVSTGTGRNLQEIRTLLERCAEQP